MVIQNIHQVILGIFAVPFFCSDLLRNQNGEYAGQLIAFSNDIEDLQLFAMEYNWNLGEPKDDEPSIDKVNTAFSADPAAIRTPTKG